MSRLTVDPSGSHLRADGAYFPLGNYLPGTWGAARTPHAVMPVEARRREAP